MQYFKVKTVIRIGQTVRFALFYDYLRKADTITSRTRIVIITK